MYVCFSKKHSLRMCACVIIPCELYDLRMALKQQSYCLLLFIAKTLSSKIIYNLHWLCVVYCLHHWKNPTKSPLISTLSTFLSFKTMKSNYFQKWKDSLFNADWSEKIFSLLEKCVYVFQTFDDVQNDKQALEYQQRIVDILLQVRFGSH